MLITFEGIDGCGKSTQLKKLCDYLHQDTEKHLVLTREPGFDKGVSGILRHLILEGDTGPIDKLFLLLADRAMHYTSKIRPLTQIGRFIKDPTKLWILCDRGPDSTVAYQGFGQNLAPVPFLVEANRVAMRSFPIDLTVVLDISPELAQERLCDDHYFEKLGPEFFYRVRDGYKSISKAEPERVVMINGVGSPDDVFQRVLSTIRTRKLL